jgi:hypothetical protein
MTRLLLRVYCERLLYYSGVVIPERRRRVRDLGGITEIPDKCSAFSGMTKLLLRIFRDDEVVASFRFDGGQCLGMRLLDHIYDRCAILFS